MTDELVAVSVLNGEVEVGDRVAVAVGSGSTPEARIGYVTGFCGSSNYPRVTVRITEVGDSYTGRRWGYVDGKYTKGDFKPYSRTFDRPHSRIVKL